MADREDRKRDKPRKRRRQEDSSASAEVGASGEAQEAAAAAVPASVGERDAKPRVKADKGGRGEKRAKPAKIPSPWTFEVDYNDHFETPSQAYRDLLPAIEVMCSKLNKPKDQVVLYDPYYCQGKMVQYLNDLGFPNVVNQNRDFYKDVARQQVPEYDILITNPPYSGEHKVRLLNYLRTTDKPFALLLPAYIATKAYWKSFLEEGDRKALYVLPPDYYHYVHPEGTGKALPPFYSAWLVGGMAAEDIQSSVAGLRRYAGSRATSPLPSMPGMPPLKAIPIKQLTGAQSLQEMVRLGVVTDNNRPNPKQRKKLLMQKFSGAVKK